LIFILLFFPFVYYFSSV